MKRKGQFNISFGIIFSIIIIIVVIAISFYVINYFLEINKCTQIGKFKDDFQNRIEKAYRGSITRDVFEGVLPSGIEYVCFGNIEQSFSGDLEVREVREYIRFYGEDDSNLHLYPDNKACDGGLAYFDIMHMETDEFFCKKVEDGKIKVSVEKDSTDALVKIK